jgi:1-deoxy-D-xylulose-5-phosphate reductoisomerase
MKNIAIIGSTGSIGTQTLAVARELKNMNIVSLCCNSNIKLLEEQIREFKPSFAAVLDEKAANELKCNIKDTNTKVLSGLNGIIEVCTKDEINIVINSAVGISGLVPTIECIKNRKEIALANKETLVTGGQMVTKLAKEYNVNILPIDSEHSAIFQCLQGNRQNKIEKIILTASGGPFRGYDMKMLEKVTVEQALKHPNWDMGSKITIDSATMMNKGLEVIEAKWLFNVEANDIEVVVHPQSFIHSAVQYEDGSIIAQMGVPDMKVPIQYALNYPLRLHNSFERLNLFDKNMEFYRPDVDNFKCLKLAYKAINLGNTAPVVLNGANEKAVELFLNRKISFLEIGNLIEDTLNAHVNSENFGEDEMSLEKVLASDLWAREHVVNLLR